MEYRSAKVLTAGEWIHRPFREIKSGDRFRLYEASGDFLGEGAALDDAYPSFNNQDVWVVDAIPEGDKVMKLRRTKAKENS